MKTNISHSSFSFRLFLVILVALGFLIMPGLSITATCADDIPYDPAEVQKIKTFLEKQSMIEGKTNADLLGITDLNEPGSWPGVGWIDKHPDSPILEPIMLDSKHVQAIQWWQSLSGSIEISGFPYLQMVSLNHYGASFGDRSKYTDINIHDNPRLESFGIKYASVGLIKIAQNPKLKFVNLDLVDTREFGMESPALTTLYSSTMGSGSLNFAAYPLLYDLQLSDCNDVTTLDLSGCPNIGILTAFGMKTMKTIRFGSKQGFISTISSNPALTSIDFRGFKPVIINCCGNLSLASFQIDRNSPLTKAEISGNPVLSSLDLSYQPDLQTLDCNENSSMTELLLLGDTNLFDVYCDNCALSSLDVSDLNSLKILNAMNNQLVDFSASGVQFTRLGLDFNKLKEISVNVAGFNINAKSYKGYGYVSFNSSKDIANPDDPNTYFKFYYDGLADPDPHTYFREIKGTGLPPGTNAWKSSFPLKTNIDATLYFDCYVHFVSWFESATGDPYDEKSVLSLKVLAGDPIGPTPPDPETKFPSNTPPPARKGFELEGWYKNIELTEVWNLKTDSVTPGLVLFPNWLPEGMPVVLSVKRESPTEENTSADHVTYLISFSKTVSGVDVSDFKLTTEGTVSGKIASVSAANGHAISVEVNSITGTGTLRLDVKNTGTGIVDADNNPLAGGYTSGEIFRFGPATGLSGSEAVANNCVVFPNPTTGMIQIYNHDNEQVSRVEVFNIQGKQVLFVNSPADNHLDLSGLPNGIYLVKIQSKTGFYNQRIVKH